MVEAYNFLGSWQLFPEKGTYDYGHRPKSGIYRIEVGGTGNMLSVSMNQVSMEDQAFASHYSVIPDGSDYEFEAGEENDFIRITLIDSIHIETHFSKGGKPALTALHEITPKGYLQVTQRRHNFERELVNVEIYHRQLSVLPYSASVSGALIRPNEEGVIRHQALTAMEEQTNMQLTQIRQQVEMLAVQAKEIQKRKELSLLVYEAKLNFSPVIGQVYHLYEQDDNTHLLSLVAPKEWGKKLPFKKAVASVQLLADHTWKEI